MSKTRKILSIVLAIVMVFGAFSVCSFAAGVSYESDETYTQEWALSEPVNNGDGTWSVNVTLKTNYPTGAIQFVVTNSSTDVTLEKVTKGDAVYYTANVQNHSNGKVVITPTTSGATAIEGKAIDGVIATLTYKVPTGKQATIAIENSPKTASKVDGSLIAARQKDLVSGSLICGQKVTSVGVSRTLGAAANPELKVIAGTNGVIDTTRTTLTAEDESTYKVDGLLYGVEICDVEDEDGNSTSQQTIGDVFAVTNGGSLNIVENAAGSKCGTGTKVEVLNASGTVVATYILVIFGDIDGNGEIDTVDSGLIEMHAGGIYDEEDGQITDTVIMLAADIDCNGEIDTVDSGLVEMHAAGIYDEIDGQMSQAEIAVKLS